MNELKVGLLALASLAAVVFMSLKVTSNQSGFGDYVTYRTIVEDASGIFPKTPIKVAGIVAGRIKNIDLQGNKALITFEVLKDVKIMKGTILRIKAVGFLGDKYLDLLIATDSNEVLPDGTLLISDSADGMEGLVKNANEALRDVVDIVKSLKTSLVPVEGEPPVTILLNDAKTLLRNLNDVTGNLKKILDGNTEALNHIVENIEDFSTNLAYQFDDTQDRSLIREFKKVGPILDNANQITSDLKKIIEDLKDGKGSVGQLLRRDEVVDQVRETLASVQKVIGKVDSLRTEVSLFTGYDDQEGSLVDAALRIYPSPERFYHFGIVSSDIGAKKKETITRDINGVVTVENREEYDRDTYRFDMQLGRKFQDFSIRGGLIESSGGVGLDYLFQPLGTAFSMEAFDYSENNGMNFRIRSETQLWNVFFGRMSYENRFSSSYKNFTISAGLRFTDEDLKGLIGFLIK